MNNYSEFFKKMKVAGNLAARALDEVTFFIKPGVSTDYLDNICYEFISKDIGAQDTFLAGGRYDGLIKKMGGPDYPGCGFAAGVERIRLLCSENLKLPSGLNYVAIAIGKENKIKAMKIINKFRGELEFNKYFPIDFNTF